MDRRTFTAVLIGETALTADCAALLLERGHQVRGMVTSNPAVRRWAAQRGVTAAGPDAGATIEAFLADHPHDYLFSVANRRVLGPAALAACAELPINFHDALLPTGAGIHATTWALVDGARTHGVTWHVMTADPDAGDVLQQRDVEIGPGETSFSLNVKCWQAGVESFGVLVDELSEGRATRTVQDMSRRTYHPRRQRPPRAMVVDWAESSADQIDAVVRATRFGPHDNEFGTVKVWLGDDAVVVTEAEVSPAASSSSAPAGTVVGLDDGVLTVATRAGDLRITELCDRAGRAITTDDLAGRVRVGSTLPELPADLAEALTAAHAEAVRYEAGWVGRLADLAPLDVPHRSAPAPAESAGLHVLDVEMPAVPRLPFVPALTAPPETADLDVGSVAAPIAGSTAAADVPQAPAGGAAPDVVVDDRTPAGRLVACVLAFLGRIGGPGAQDVGVRCTVDPATPVLFATDLPLRIPEPRGDLPTYEREVRRRLDELTARGSHLLDLPARYVELAGGIAAMPIVVELVDGFEQLGPRPRPRHQPGNAPRPALQVQVTRDGRRCRWIVDGDVWPLASAEILRDSFVTFLRSVQDHDLDEAPLVDDRERKALNRHNDTAAEYPRQRCVPQLFAEQARCQPEATALTHGDQTLTYGELDRRVNQLADFLGRSGVGPGDLVGVHLDRSIDMVVALLGVLRAGAAYVPLDPIYPAARIVEMLADADVALLLTHGHLESDDLAAAVPEVVALDSRWPEIESVADDSPCDRASADALAYVIYTSGSTGRPKGVRIGHRALTNLLWSMAREPGFGHEDSLLALTTICFDIAALELFLPLVTGGRVEIVPSAVAADGVALRRAVEEAGPSVVQATPATWKMLIAAGWTGDDSLRALCGGEALTPELAAELTARAGAVWNVYGPTEMTVWSAISPVEPGSPVTLGRPIANTRLHVLDAAMRPLPRGVPGELYIGGDGVGAGYLHRPELTGERFRPDPFAPEAGERLYRTGDLVRLGPAGDLEFLGRIDHQVKIRGFRVELGEIEVALADHADVDQTVVVLHTGAAVAAGPARLVAYVTAAEGRMPDPAELQADLGRRLPEHMVPAAVVVLGALPLTPNGKVDRKALPAPALRAATAADEMPPRTARERVLCTLFAEVLGVDAGEVGLGSNFFDAGGDSVVVTTLVARSRDAGLTLQARDVFEHPTPGALDRYLDARDQSRSNVQVSGGITSVAAPAAAGLSAAGVAGGEATFAAGLGAAGPAGPAGEPVAAGPVGTSAAGDVAGSAAATRVSGSAAIATAGAQVTGAAATAAAAGTAGEAETQARHPARALSPAILADVALADDLLADLATTTATLPVLADPEHVLLTGATGFVGAFLLRELVRSTGATVHCLVRGQDRQQAFARLRATLARYELWDEVSSADVAVVVGDLRRPDLGLDAPAFDELAQTVDSVFHAGAAVSWLHPYAELRAANVLGAEQVLRLTARARHRHRSIPVHHVSSMGVFAQGRFDGSRHGVDAPIGPLEGLVTGYQQTKWVAEHKLDAARQQGIPVSCYRVARVSGDSRTGACQTDDLLWRILKGSMQAGGIPDHADMLLDLVPVDHVAAALVWLSRQPDTAGGTFHLANPQLTSFRAVVAHLRGLGWPLPDIDREKWAELVGADPGNAAHPLVDAFMETAWDPEGVEIPLDPSATVARLDGSGVECPPVDAPLLDRYVGYFLRNGFLDRP